MFGRRFTLFRLLGFEVGVDLSWLLLAILVTWTLAVGFFPFQFPGLETGTYWWMGVVGALGLFFSIVWHEFSHSLVARHYGLPISGITLFLFGGVAQMTEEPRAPRVEFLVAVVGPISSFLLAAIFFGLGFAADGAGLPTAVGGVLSYLVWINLLLAIFNLIPAFPLDGGRMLRAALWGWRGDLRWATRIASGFGSGFGILLIVLGIVSIVSGNFIGGLWWFLIGLFIRGAAGASYQQTLMREALRGVPVSRVMNDRPVTVPPDLPVGDLVEEYFYRHYFKMFPVVEGDGRVVGCVTLRRISDLPRERWHDTPVGAVMQPCDRDNTVGPNMEAIDALSRMQRSGISRLLVADHGRLAGIVTLKDMLRFLAFKLELEEGQKVDFGSLMQGAGDRDRDASPVPDRPLPERPGRSRSRWARPADGRHS